MGASLRSVNQPTFKRRREDRLWILDNLPSTFENITYTVGLIDRGSLEKYAAWKKINLARLEFYSSWYLGFLIASFGGTLLE